LTNLAFYTRKTEKEANAGAAGTARLIQRGRARSPLRGSLATFGIFNACGG